MSDKKKNPEHTGEATVPAGGAGADSGAVDAVGVEPGDEASVPNTSPQNDIAGVGTRGPDDPEAT